jgi:hypothetical protein
MALKGNIYDLESIKGKDVDSKNISDYKTQILRIIANNELLANHNSDAIIRQK